MAKWMTPKCLSRGKFAQQLLSPTEKIYSRLLTRQRVRIAVKFVTQITYISPVFTWQPGANIATPKRSNHNYLFLWNASLSFAMVYRVVQAWPKNTKQYTMGLQCFANCEILYIQKNRRIRGSLWPFEVARKPVKKSSITQSKMEWVAIKIRFVCHFVRSTKHLNVSLNVRMVDRIDVWCIRSNANTATKINHQHKLQHSLHSIRRVYVFFLLFKWIHDCDLIHDCGRLNCEIAYAFCVCVVKIAFEWAHC